jgi:hypothetical protein
VVPHQTEAHGNRCTKVDVGTDAGSICVQHGVSKGEEDGHRPSALRAATPRTAVRPFEGLAALRAWKRQDMEGSGEIGSPWPPLAIRPWQVLLTRLTEEEKGVVLPIFRKNFYWGHSENLWLAQLADADPAIRLDAVNKILDLRHAPSPAPLSTTRRRKKSATSKFRNFEVPELILDASDYTQMIGKADQVFEPPFTLDLSDADIKKFVDTPLVLKVPGHTQHVERLVQTITKIGTRAATRKKRDGITRATLASRKSLPKCETKAQFSKR